MALAKSKKSKTFRKRKTKCNYSKAKRGGSKKTTKKHVKKTGKKSSRKFKGGGIMTAEETKMTAEETKMLNDMAKKAQNIVDKQRINRTKPSKLKGNQGFTNEYMEVIKPIGERKDTRNSFIIEQPAELSVHTRNAITGNSDPSALDNVAAAAHPDRVDQKRRAAKEAAGVRLSRVNSRTFLSHTVSAGPG